MDVPMDTGDCSVLSPPESPRSKSALASGALDPDSMELLMQHIEVKLKNYRKTKEMMELEFLNYTQMEIPSTGHRCASFSCGGQIVKPPQFRPDEDLMSEPFPFHSHGYVRGGELARSLQRQEPTLHVQGDIVSLFGQSFPMHALLTAEMSDTILNLFCQRIAIMEVLSAEGSKLLPNLGRAFLWQEAVDDIRHFLGYLRHISFHFKRMAFRVQQPSNEPSSLSVFLRALETVNLYVYPLHQIKNVSLVHLVTSSAPNFTATYFHLVLDIRWTLFEAMTFLAEPVVEKDEIWTVMSEPPQFCSICAGFSIDEVLSRAKRREQNQTADVTLDLGQNHLTPLKLQLLVVNLHELLAVSWGRFDSRRQQDSRQLLNSSAFECVCVTEFWFMTMKHADGVEPGLIWELLMQLLALHDGEAQDADKRGTIPSSLSGHDVQVLKVSTTYVWWLLNSLMPVTRLDHHGLWSSDISHVAKNLSMVFVESWLLKATLKNMEKKLDETTTRFVLRVLLFLGKVWGPRWQIITTLWDFFHARLNSLFGRGGLSVEEVAIIPPTSASWIQSALGSRGLENANSFELFLQLFDVHCPTKTAEDIKIHERTLNRVLSKMSTKKLRELNDSGWFHLLSLVMKTLRSSSQPKTILERWLTVLDSWKLEDRNSRVTNVYLKGLGAVILLASSLEVNPKPVFETFNKHLEHVVNLSMAAPNNTVISVASEKAVQVYSEILKEVICRNKLQDVISDALVPPCIGKRLRNCRASEIRLLLSALTVLVTKIRKFCNRAETDPSLCIDGVKEVSKTEESLWNSVFPAVKKELSCNTSAPSPEVADFVTGMLMLLLDKRKDGTEFQNLFRFFALSPTVLPEISCQLLANFLQQGPKIVNTLRSMEIATASMDLSKKHTKDLYLVISGWLRCATFMYENLEDKSRWDALSQLSTEVFLLPEMSRVYPYLDLSYEGENKPKHSLQVLLEALGSFQKCESRERIAQLRNDFQRYLDVVTMNICAANARAETNKQFMRHLYRTGSSMIENCANLLYYNNQVGSCEIASVNLLNKLMNELFLFPSAKSDAVALSPHKREVIGKSLAAVLKGFSSLPALSNDAFVARALSDLYKIYLPKFDPKNHPFLCVFTNFIQQDRREEMQKYFLIVLRREFFDGSLHARNKYSVTMVLKFLKEAIVLARSDAFMSMATGIVFYPLLKLWIRSQDQENIRKAAEDLIRLFVSHYVDNGERRGSFRRSIQKHIQNVVEDDMPYHSKTVFHLLHAVKRFDRDLIIDLTTFLQSEVAKIQAKRGNKDSGMNDWLRSLTN